MVPRCTYCSSDASTADHCPPKLLFPRPRPFNLVTVPACLKCNRTSSKDEEYFRALLMLTECGLSPAGERLRADKSGRALERGKLAQRIGGAMRWTEVRTESGIHLGQQLVVSAEFGRLEAIGKKIARGLYRLEFGTPLGPDVGVFARFLIAERFLESIAPTLQHTSWGHHRWEGVFDYRFRRMESKPEVSFWIMRLYNTAFMVVSTAPQDIYQGWVERARTTPSQIYLPLDLPTLMNTLPDKR